MGGDGCEQLVQLGGEEQLILKRKVDPFALAAVS